MSPAVNIPAITGGVVEYYEGPLATFTVKSGQTVSGGMLVELTAAMEVQKAGANSAKVVGLAMHDADGSGDIKKVTVWMKGAVLPMKAAGAVTAMDYLVPAANGAVATAGAAAASDARTAIGLALESIADTATGRVLMFGGAR